MSIRNRIFTRLSGPLLSGLVLFIVASMTWMAFAPSRKGPDRPYISPIDLAYSEDGAYLAVIDHTGDRLSLFGSGKFPEKEVNGLDKPFGLAWVSEGTIAVSEYGGHSISVIDPKRGKIKSRIDCVKYPMGIAGFDKDKVLVAGFGQNEIGIVDLEKQKQVATIPVHYQPDFITVSPGHELAFVSNLSPGSIRKGALISVIDLDSYALEGNIELPFGSTNIRQIRCSSDGKWVYVVHTFGKVMLPTSQLERGWVNTNVLSILDVDSRSLYVTLPFDFTTRGAADPWGIELSADGKYLFATLAGVNELAVIQLDKLHAYLAGDERPVRLRTSDANARIAYDVWAEIYEDPSRRDMLSGQFSALYAAGLFERIPLPQEGPRGISMSPDGTVLAVAGYFSGDISLVDAVSFEEIASLSLGEQVPESLVRRGERLFHDGTTTYQSWLSCSSCHPAGRADGLNWDLLNDGIGNPKNAKSLLQAHLTAPSMSTGIRADYDVASLAGFNFIKFVEAESGDVEAVKAYLRNMKPDPSPFLTDGKLSSSALRGKLLFESSEVGCIHCHSGPGFTDRKMHNIGTGGNYDRTEVFDTPSLIELWRTAPYLHDGSIENLEDLFTVRENTGHWHGRTVDLEEDDITDLIAYIKSI